MESSRSGKMMQSQSGIRESPIHRSSAGVSHGKSFFIAGTTGVQNYAPVQHHLARQDGLSVRRRESKTAPASSVKDLPPPGLYPNDMTVPRRPQMIMEDTIKEFKERTSVSQGKPSKGRGKDIHRHLRVVHVVGEFVREHNELKSEDPYMQYRWYGTDRTDSQITANLLAIIEDTAYAVIPHLYSRFTYNDAQNRDGASMESLVARVSSNEMFDPLTQTLRVFGIRRLIQEKMANKKKTATRRQKKMSQSERTDELALQRHLSLMPVSDKANLTVPDLPSDVPVISNYLEHSLHIEADEYEPHNTPAHRRIGQNQNIEFSGLESQPVANNSSSPFRLDGTPEQESEVGDVEDATRASSPAHAKYAHQPQSKPRRNKGKKTQSKTARVASKSRVISKGTTTKDGQKSLSSRTKRAGIDANSAGKSRKRKQIDQESYGSESSADNTDSEDQETELAELKKRMKEIEKRNAKKKSKKKRCGQ